MVTERFMAKDKNMQQTDVDAVEQRIDKIEKNPSAIDNRKWFKPLAHTNGLAEILVQTGGKAVRIHCCQDGNDVVAFNGYAKEGKSNQAMIAEAQKLKKKWEEQELNVREIPNAYRL